MDLQQAASPSSLIGGSQSDESVAPPAEVPAKHHQFLRIGIIGPAAILVACIGWAYWPVLKSIASIWASDQNYSAGQLAPFVALFAVWRERRQLAKVSIRPCWIGVVVMAIGHGVHVYGQIYMYGSLERYALVLTIVGVVILIGGLRLSRKLVWVLLFLFVAMPLPNRVYQAITGPLQHFAAVSSTFILETAGWDVVRQGNVMLVDGTELIAVAEACNGLRMLTSFIIVSFAMAYVADRKPWERIAIFASGVPIAIICNSIRLVVTAILFTKVSGETAKLFLHDFAGIFMIPLAIALLIFEVWVIKRLIVPEESMETPPEKEEVFA
jgi:exosortase